MSDLDATTRDSLKDSNFAYVDSAGDRHLPIHDAAHVRNALARWNQTHFEYQSAKDAAQKRILIAAKNHQIDVSDDDKVNH